MVFPVVMYGCESWTVKKAEHRRLMLLNCGVGEDSWESLGLQGDPTSPFWRRSTLGFRWKDWCWSWSPSTLATSCKELTHWKKLWCWEGLGAGGEGDDRGWDGWMVSQTRWTWVWVNSGRWWWTGRPGMLRFMGSQRVGHNGVNELNWTELKLLRACKWLQSKKEYVISLKTCDALNPKRTWFVHINMYSIIHRYVQGLFYLKGLFVFFLNNNPFPWHCLFYSSLIIIFETILLNYSINTEMCTV